MELEMVKLKYVYIVEKLYFYTRKMYVRFAQNVVISSPILATKTIKGRKPSENSKRYN